MLVMDGGTKSFHPFTSKEDTLKMLTQRRKSQGMGEGMGEGRREGRRDEGHREKTGTLEGREQHSLPMDFISLL